MDMRRAFWLYVLFSLPVAFLLFVVLLDFSLFVYPTIISTFFDIINSFVVTR